MEEVKVSNNAPNELDELRNSVISYLEGKLKNKKLSPGLEKSLYDYTMSNTSLDEIKMFKYQIFKQRYNYSLCFIVLNISEFETKINNEEITISDIFNKTPIELFPEKWEESFKRKKEEEKFLYETNLVSNSKTAMCFKCKEKNVYVKTKQTRSADEPETIFYTCLTCHNKWKT